MHRCGESPGSAAAKDGQAVLIAKGRYVVRLAADAADLVRVMDLRQQVFRLRREISGPDTDLFDAPCLHVVIEDAGSGALVCCYRLLPLRSGAEIGQSYAAQFYDLTRLRSFAGPMLELGRFCLHPDHHDPDILRLAWGAMARLVDAQGVAMLFGCSSFDGADPARHRAALGVLRSGHLAPDLWRPEPMAGAYPYARTIAEAADLRAGLLAMPPLLRTYLAMGGWVSDHAVPDTDLDTLHVFTAVDIARIPPARARALRAIAG